MGVVETVCWAELFLALIVFYGILRLACSMGGLAIGVIYKGCFQEAKGEVVLVSGIVNTVCMHVGPLDRGSQVWYVDFTKSAAACLWHFFSMSHLRKDMSHDTCLPLMLQII